MLTPAQYDFLAKPFAILEHGFVNGQCFIRKSAIRRRLSALAPWSLSEPKLLMQSDRLIVLTATLSINGDTRSGVGTAVYLTTSTDKTTGEITDLAPDMIARNMAKAVKSAASDIIPRAALEFGVGAYLKDAEAKPKNPHDLKALLGRLGPAPTAPPPQSEPETLLKADADHLDALCQKHLDTTLLEFLNRNDPDGYAAFIARYKTLEDAQKALAARIVDSGVGIKIFTASTETARNNSVYLSLSFGFNAVSVFNGDVDRVFKNTPYLMTGWRIAGFKIDFQPPVVAFMSRDTKGYPRVDRLETLPEPVAS